MAGHPFIPPPEFDPRDRQALAAMARQNHQNSVRQSQVLVVIWSIITWPIRFVFRRLRR